MALEKAARDLHFTERTVEAILRRAFPGASKRTEIGAVYELGRVRRKQVDAVLLLNEMEHSTARPTRLPTWQLTTSASLETLLLGTRRLAPGTR